MWVGGRGGWIVFDCVVGAVVALAALAAGCSAWQAAASAVNAWASEAAFVVVALPGGCSLS